MSYSIDDEDEGLGRLVSEHRPFNWSILLYIGLPLGVIGVPFAIFALPTKNSALIAPSMLFAVGGVVMIVLTLIGWAYTAGLAVDLHEGGVAILSGSRPLSCTWDEIESVTYGSEGWFLDYTITLNLREGRRLPLDPQLFGLEKVYRAVVRNTIDRLLAQANAELDRGRLLDFGNGLTMDSQRLLHEDSRLDFRDVREVLVGRQVFPATNAIRPAIFISGRDVGGLVVPLLGIRNLHVLNNLFINRFDIPVYIDPNVMEPQDGELDGAKHGK